MAFFVATPELGLDAVLLSVPLLGSSLTLARVVTAFVVAVLVALLVGTASPSFLEFQDGVVKCQLYPANETIVEIPQPRKKIPTIRNKDAKSIRNVI